MCGLCFGDLWYVQNLMVIIAILSVLQKFQFSDKEIIICILLTVFLEGKLLRALTGVAFGMYLLRAQEDEKRMESIRRFRVLGSMALVILIVTYETMEYGFDAVWMKYVSNLAWNVTGLWIAAMVLWADRKRCEAGKQPSRTYYLTKLSTIIYFVHLAIVPLSYGVVARYLPAIAALGGRSIIWSGTVAMLTFAASMVFAVGVLTLSEKKGFQWLKYIY